MEERSDRLAQSLEGESAVAYARALEKLYAANLLPVVVRGKRQVHPHLYDRLVAVGVPPAYPRPAPPRGVVLAMLPSLLLMVVCLWEAMPTVEEYEARLDHRPPVKSVIPNDRQPLPSELVTRPVERWRRKPDPNQPNRDSSP
jgi:hypothetical protein